MRNIMLAATAIAGFGILAAGTAQAQMPNQGIVTNSLSAPTYSGTFPEPGTITVYLKTRFLADFGFASDSLTNYNPGAGAVSATHPAGANVGTTTGTKTSGVEVQEWMRFYPGFDGKTNHGLEYGAAAEIRAENQVGTPQSSTNPGTGGGTQFSVNSTSGSALFLRREAAYVGTAQLGRLWFGSADGALGRLNVGSVSPCYDTDCGWLGGPAYMVNTNARIDYGFPAATSNFYGQNKLVYVSPVLAGFDFAVDYEPNAGVGQSSCADEPLANNCLDVASALATSSVVVVGQRRNTFEAALRYRGSFGPAAVAASVGTMQSGTVTTNVYNAATTAVVAGGTVPATLSGYESATAAKIKGINIYDAGLQVSAFGFTVAGQVLGGDLNSDGGSLLRQGQKKTTDFLMNANYVFGPFTVGVQYLNNLSAGFGQSYANGAIANGKSMLHQVGYGVGGSFDYAPGAQLWVSALYGTRHQDGVNIQAAASYAGTYSTSAGTLNTSNSLYTHLGNSTVARAIAIGNTFAF